MSGEGPQGSFCVFIELQGTCKSKTIPNAFAVLLSTENVLLPLSCRKISGRLISTILLSVQSCYIARRLSACENGLRTRRKGPSNNAMRSRDLSF